MMYWIVFSLVAIELPLQFSQLGAATKENQHRYTLILSYHQVQGIVLYYHHPH